MMKKEPQSIQNESNGVNNPTRNDLTPEEAAQQWFSEQYGTEIPDVLRKLFRHWAYLEAKRQKVGEHILDENEQLKIQERIRLLQTKLNNIIQTIEDLQEEKKWIYQFEILLNNLNKQKAAYLEINKKYNAYLTEIRSLEQFEAFEAVLGNYERIKVIEKAWSEQRESSKKQLHNTTNQESVYTNSLKTVEQKEKEYTEAVSQAVNAQNLIADGYHLQANIYEYNARIKELKEQLEQTLLTLNPLKQAVLEAENEQKKTEAVYAEKQQALQNMNSLQKMIESGETILAKLKFLFSLKKRKEELQQQLETSLKKQNEENEKLNKLFMASKDADAHIKTLQSELQVHQKSIVGMNSYTLQQRAMTLKSKMEQLYNANQLWEQISKGYILIDEKSLEITRMQMHNETLQTDISKLEIEVSAMRKQCEELKYAYTLSKSQDVMQLRKDLQEGSNCCVCGATHHPYHSDTILEQSKLIGEMKTEYEQAANELKLTEKKLAELKREQAIEEGKLEVSYQALIIYKKIQQSNVANWSAFIPLDRSFNECSPSTNLEARRSMLQQLIEKTGLDEENAQKELDTFNYHQSNINALNEKLTESGKLSIFFTLEINALSEEAFQALLKDKNVAFYRPWLEKIRLFKPYELAEDMEALLADKALTSSAAWVRLYDETSSKLKYIVNGKEYNDAELSKLLQDKDPKVREAAGKEMNRVNKENGELFTFIYNMIIKDKAISDDKRGFKSPIASRNLDNMVEDEVVDSLAEAVRAKYVSISERFYKLKAKWLGKEKIQYWDRNAPLPFADDKKYSWV